VATKVVKMDRFTLLSSKNSFSQLKNRLPPLPFQREIVYPTLCPLSLCPRSLCPLVTLSPGHFVPGHFVPWSLCPLVTLSPGHFVPGHFVPWSLCPLVTLSPVTLSPVTLSPIFEFWNDMMCRSIYFKTVSEHAFKTGINEI
jgi:hypothetical protein